MNAVHRNKSLQKRLYLDNLLWAARTEWNAAAMLSTSPIRIFEIRPLDLTILRV